MVLALKFGCFVVLVLWFYVLYKSTDKKYIDNPRI